MDKVVFFNVGGRSFAIREELITKYPDTLLFALIKSKDSLKDNNGAFFIDRNPEMFSFILEYYRQDKIIYPTIMSESVFDRELDFYLIKTLGETDNSKDIFGIIAKLYVYKRMKEIQEASKCPYNTLYMSQELKDILAGIVVGSLYIGTMGNTHYFVLMKDNQARSEIVNFLNNISTSKGEKPIIFKPNGKDSFIDDKGLVLIIPEKLKANCLDDGSIYIMSATFQL